MKRKRAKNASCEANEMASKIVVCYLKLNVVWCGVQLCILRHLFAFTLTKAIQLGTYFAF